VAEDVEDNKRINTLLQNIEKEFEDMDELLREVDNVLP
jgi:hypothetical protein